MSYAGKEYAGKCSKMQVLFIVSLLVKNQIMAAQIKKKKPPVGSEGFR